MNYKHVYKRYTYICMVHNNWHLYYTIENALFYFSHLKYWSSHRIYKQILRLRCRVHEFNLWCLCICNRNMVNKFIRYDPNHVVVHWNKAKCCVIMLYKYMSSRIIGINLTIAKSFYKRCSYTYFENTSLLRETAFGDQPFILDRLFLPTTSQNAVKISIQRISSFTATLFQHGQVAICNLW